MITVYVYVLDTMADWEIGHAISELKSGRFFKPDAQEVLVKTVACLNEPVTTMGGLMLLPECLVEDIEVAENTVLLLPGADAWSNPCHGAVIEKAQDILAKGGSVAAICGATVALAEKGLLNDRPHTSNGPGFLQMFVSNYTGQQWYEDVPSVADGNLITAGSTGGLLWAKQLLEHLGVLHPATLQAWYDYFSTGRPEHYFALLQSLN